MTSTLSETDISDLEKLWSDFKTQCMMLVQTPRGSETYRQCPNTAEFVVKFVSTCSGRREVLEICKTCREDSLTLGPPRCSDCYSYACVEEVI